MVKALRYTFFALMVAVMAAGLYVLPRATYETDIMALVPPGADAPEVAQANEQLSDVVVERAFFLLSSTDWRASQNAASAFMERLNQCACVDRVSSAPSSSKFQHLRDLYLQYAPLLLSEKDRVLLEQGQTGALLKSAMRDLQSRGAEAPVAPPRAEGASPSTAPPAETPMEDAIPEDEQVSAFALDPLTTAGDFTDSLREQSVGRGEVENGLLNFRDDNSGRRYILVAADLSASPYALATQVEFSDAVASASDVFHRSAPEGEILRMGDVFAAQAVMEQTGWELTVIGIGTLLGIVLILLAVLRSIWLVLLALLPISIGAVTGLVATTLIFGSVHLVALVVGFTLVGVSIDYSLHFLCRRLAMGTAWQSDTAIKRLFPGLTLGLVTSSAGYLAFIAAGLEALQQIAVFATAGLLAAYLIVVGLYPVLLRSPSQRTMSKPLQQNVARYLDGSQEQLRRLKHPEVFLALAALAAISIWQLKPADDLRVMQPPDEAVQQESGRFRTIADGMANNEYLLVEANNSEALLQKLEQLKGPLRQLKDERVMQNAFNLSDWVPSIATQQNNNRLLNEQLIKSGLFKQYLDHLGATPERQQAILNAYSSAGGQWLRIGQVVPVLEELLDRPLYFTYRDKHYSLVLFEGLRDFRPLQGLAAGIDGVTWVDRAVAANRLLAEYRFRITGVLVGAYLLTLLLLCIRYGWRGALAVVAPPFVASAFTLMVLAWFGVSVTLLNMVGLLLILGLGIDYALFLREHRGRDCGAFVAIAMSAATTMLVFGLLMLSATYAIFSFGLTVCLGIGLTFLLTPLAIGSAPLHGRSGASCQ